MANKDKLKKLSIEYLKSYFSINSYIGCTFNCAYCFLAPVKIVPMRPVKSMEEEDLIKEMIESSYFKKGETVISLNNRTDPFLTEEVKSSTFKLLDLMEREGLKNIVTITTKGLLTKEDAKVLDKYKNIDIVIIVTYNGLPQNIQPVSPSIQEETMRNVSTCKNVKLLHQCRPIIPDVNDSEESIREVVTFAKQYCIATIYQGIRVNPYIKGRLAERGYNYEGDFDKHKQKTKETDEIFNKIEKELKDYPIFDHTSCCLSYLYDKPDYNLHFTKMECDKSCKNYERCHKKFYDLDYNLQEELDRLGVNAPWELRDDLLYVDGILNDEQKSYIKHILHLQVKSAEREYTYSENIMEERYEGKNNI